MNRVYNFSSGPAQLPLDVLVKAQAELVDFNSTGMSVMEMSHRSAAYKDVIDNAEKNLRKLYNISDDYAVLFLQGGASLQFSMVPMNLKKSGSADFIDSGYWSQKAIKEAKKYLDVNVVCSTKDENFNSLPKFDGIDFKGDYVYMTSNNTIYGTEFKSYPKTGNIPLVADMSSDILSRKLDVNDFGIIFAGAQKNIGPSGLCVTIIRKDLIGNAPENIPIMLDYKTHADNGSMYNTPPTYGIYVAGLVFEWMLAQGGVEAFEKINAEKAALVYDFIDNSDFYSNTIPAADRSLMNIVFKTANEDLDKKFAKDAAAKGLISLGGHRAVGGLRASIYNAMPIEGVKALVEFMKEFELANK
ncbi:MAG: 3-phosphoserine/phosphohydroxythreonine transaminase [Clostridia bacterium]|nr:3-phosphoserine/phosphohydroxythreonine transaminase [Clostridia bacterium]